jgi:hypothetical protein
MGYGVTQATAQEQQKQLPPLSLPTAERLTNDPQAMAEWMARLPAVPATQLAPTEPASSPWRHSVIPFPGTNGTAGNQLLLTDGTVLVHDNCGADWWKLTPDIHGGYVGGSWRRIASLPAGYKPLYFGSAVLPDGPRDHRGRRIQQLGGGAVQPRHDGLDGDRRGQVRPL